MEAGRINKNPNPWSIVPHLRGLVFQLVKKRPVFLQPECSLPPSQKPGICPYPEPDQSSPFVPWIYLRFILVLHCQLGLGLPSGIFPSGFPTKTRYASPLSHTCYMPCFLIIFYLSSVQYLVRVVSHEGLCFAISSPLSCRPTYYQRRFRYLPQYPTLQ